MLQVADLPFAVKGLVGASLNNVIYMFGENFIIQIKIIISGITTHCTGGKAEGKRNYQDQILKYVPSEDKWERAGTMKSKRIGHSVAVINVTDYCQ